MHFFYVHVITVFLTLPCVKACAEWTIINPPIIFGHTAQLGCLINTTIGNSSTRTWFGGGSNAILSLNGAPSDPTKYGEKLQWQNGKLESILEIKQFDENDVNCDYSCSVGLYCENKKTLRLTEDKFEFHPESSGVTVFAVLTYSQLIVFIRINKVYPIPQCRVTFNELVITKIIDDKVEHRGIFFMITQQLKHKLKRTVCSGQLQVYCKVGATELHIYKENLNYCSGTTTATSTTTSTTERHENTITIIKEIIGPIAVLFICFLFFVIAFVFVRYRNFRQVIVCCCFKNTRRTSISQNELEIQLTGRNCESTTV